ncbi:MAG TPA: TonB C-terminal domain-containing protein [Polyangia bacterium]|jgi:TonB family protein|nr:TonB C-terminal domain-containing protein [Polyangia bacterium]
MSQRARSRARGFLSRGALFSLLLHVHLLTPIGVVIWIFAGRQQAAREAQRAQEMDVEFQDASAAQLPKDLPPIEPPPDQLQPPKPQQPKPKPIAREKKPDEKQAKPEEKPQEKPEPEKKVAEAPKPEPPPPPPPELREGHEKIVDQENDKNEPPPPEANYLAQNNHHTDEEKRATETTLEKRRHDNKKSELPTDEKDKIADLEEQKSALGRKAPDVTPHENPQVAEAQEKKNEPKSLLALRDPAPRTHEISPETADPSLPKAADGDIAAARPARGAPADPAHVKAGDKVKLALSQKDFEYLFGADAEAERRLAEKHRSTRKGKLAEKVARVQAALENFTPEVRPGNTTDLNTRAAPFAAYIARMHRSIHQHWGFEQLEAWEEMSGTSPFNNSKLATTLEAVLNRDGTIDKVAIVRTSGYLAFDAAAIDVLYTSGPFPDPPREIRSPDGKIYVHWTFHRDDRQCTPAFTQYFILAEKPHPREKGAVVDRPEAAHATGGGAVGEAVHPSAAAPGAPAPAGAGAPPASPGEAPAPPRPPTTAGDDGPRRLHRYEDSRHRATMHQLDQEVAAAEEKAGVSPAPAAPTEAQSAIARAGDPAARAVAERWFKALASGDADVLASLAVLPFKTSGKDVSKRATLTAMLADLVSEEKAAHARTLQVFTTAGLRAAIGKLPANVDDGSGTQLYALASNGERDALILILAKRGTDWKPIGLVRR